jgi:hypothetical protein
MSKAEMTLVCGMMRAVVAMRTRPWEEVEAILEMLRLRLKPNDRAWFWG